MEAIKLKDLNRITKDLLMSTMVEGGENKQFVIYIR
jgi:hypothetical protein